MCVCVCRLSVRVCIYMNMHARPDLDWPMHNITAGLSLTLAVKDISSPECEACVVITPATETFNCNFSEYI